jgi:23S rRNA (adenine2503-C2)-methyltransferase
VRLEAAGIGKAKMRAAQIWRWMYHYGVTEFDAMTNIAKDLRAELAKQFTLARPEIIERQVS